jgi:hypothetical protein
VTGIEPALQQLIYGSVVLKEEQTLGENEVADNATIVLSQPMRATDDGHAAKDVVCIAVPPTMQTHSSSCLTVECTPARTVSALYALMADAIAVPASSFALCFGGKALDSASQETLGSLCVPGGHAL